MKPKGVPELPQEPVYSSIEGEYINLHGPVQEYPDYRHRGAEETHYLEPLKTEVPAPPPGPRPQRASGLEVPVRDSKKRGCKQPPCWGWILIVAVFGLLGTLVALSVLLYTSRRVTCPRTPLEHTKDGLPSKDDGDAVIVECLTGARVHGGWKNYVATCQLGKWDVTESCVFVDCKGAYDNGHHTSGIYTISPDGRTIIKVYCEQRMDKGGWTVIQKRQYGNVSFDKKWTDYKKGFGDLTGDFWLGNDDIHILTAGRDQKLKIEMTHPDGTHATADYSSFRVENESNLYRLDVSGFVGGNPLGGNPLGDSFTQHSGHRFSTPDRDNDSYNTSCAAESKAGWWFTSCYMSLLNGVYNSTYTKGIRWRGFTKDGESLTYVRMMIKKG